MKLSVVLAPILSTEEDGRILPLITDPAVVTLHSLPVRTRIDLEMHALLVGVVKD